MATVLLVEDEEVQRKAMEAVLRSGKHQILLAGNGAQAFLLAMDRRPDIVIADYNTPKVNGAELCRKVRAEKSLDGVYLLVVTAAEGDQPRLESLGSGADDFLRKPVRPEELLNRVDIALRLRDLRAQVAERDRRAAVLAATQETLVAALDAAVRGFEATSARFASGDPDGAHASLRASHEELRGALSRIVLPEEGA
jgi:DNA-binding response OmpR family regulator